MEASQQQQSPAEFLSSVEILSPFTREELEQLASAAEVRHYAFGDTICKAGEPADGLYVVKSGSVRVFSEEHGKEISTGVRKAGEAFADIAMLRDYRHELSARASLKTELWFIPRKAIAPVIAHNPVAQDFVTSYVAISSAGGLVARLFDLRGKVSKDELEEFVRSVGVKRVVAGKEILKQGGRDDRRLYVLRQGLVRLAYNDGADEFVLATLQPGETFGEKACLMRQEQMVSAVAATDVTLLVIPEKTAHPRAQRWPARGTGRPDPFRRTRAGAPEKTGRAAQAPAAARPAVDARVRRKDHQALCPGRAGRGNGLRRGLPGHAVPSLRAANHARQTARTGQRHHPGRHPRQPRARF
jgi:ATP-binding cassette subfamily B protein